MQLLCADADFRTQSELCAVCKGSRGVDVDAGGIYFAAEPVGMFFVFGYDTFAVFGTILLYVCYGAVYAFNDFYSQFVVQKFRTEILFRGFFQQFRRIVALHRGRAGLSCGRRLRAGSPKHCIR